MKQMMTAIIALFVLWSGSTFAELAQRSNDRHPAPGMLERPGLKNFKAPQVKIGESVNAYELVWEHPKPAEVVDKMSAVASLMLDQKAGHEVTADKEVGNVFYSALTKENVGTWTRVEGTPLLAKYDSRYNEIRMLNSERDAFGVTEKDIGVGGASRIAEDILARMGEQGVVDPRLYATAAMQIGYEMIGTGSVKADAGPGRVSAYRITYRPRLDGFEMVNAGIRLGIRSSGELYSLRIGGVTPQVRWQAGEPVPAENGGIHRVRIDANALMKRFYQQIPKGMEPEVAWSRIMYVMPEDENRAVVAPMFLISWTALQGHDDVRISSRRKTLAYSLIDPRADPIEFDKPVQEHGSTNVTREAPAK